MNDTKNEKWPSGSLEVQYPASNVIKFKLVGYAEKGSEQLIIKYTEELIKIGKHIHVFHDWYDMSGYDAECRQNLTKYLEGRNNEIISANILVKSHLVEMGVNIANIILGKKIEMYTNSKKFYDKLEEKVAGKE